MDRSNKTFISVCYAGFLLWQCYIAYVSHRQALLLDDLFSDFGTELPGITQVMLAYGPWFFLVPVVIGIASLVVFKFKSTTITAPLVVLVILVASTFSMQAIFVEGAFAPINDMMNVIG